MERLPIVQERLLIARRRAGLSQGDLAQRAGVHISDISKYERGRSVPTLARLARLCRALGVSADYLLGLSGEEDAA
jgi:transcriptional regulator with XRE-family HTH domain